MSAEPKLLLIDDDAGIRNTLQRVFSGEGYQVTTAERGDEGLERTARETFNAVITDLRMPGVNGMELVQRLHRLQPRLPIILVTAFGTAETAIEATKFGAYDYLIKPFDIPQLIELVRKAVETNRIVSEAVAFGDSRPPRDALVGHSSAMQAIYKEIGRAASKPVNVLIRGETGTGKELVARALYQHSERTNAPFITINCAAIPETLLESELFGHERGAFTGAETRRIGRFEQANRGTIFLDEIGDLPLGTQVKLLRVLQERYVQRLGGNETIPVDVRVVAATHRDLETAIRHKQFREDLFYRLSVVVITLPALRHRQEDIPELIHFFLQKYGSELGNPDPSIRPEAIEFLRVQSWPGNVRELENTVRKALLLAQAHPIGVEHVRAAAAKPLLRAGPLVAPFGEYVDELLLAVRRGEISDAHARLLEEAERELISRAIAQAHGNQAQAARWLGISRVTMKAKLLQFGIHPSQDQREL
jgi:nitrogen regulation protein NR(I)